MDDPRSKRQLYLHEVFKALASSVKKAEEAMAPKKEDERKFFISSLEIDFPAKLGMIRNDSKNAEGITHSTMVEFPGEEIKGDTVFPMASTDNNESTPLRGSIPDSHLARIKLKIK